MRFGLIILIFAALLLSSCASGDPQENTGLTVEAAPENETTSEVYVYSEKPAVSDSLELRGEPTLLSSGYARLVGVVRGEKSVALIEIGGRGLTAVAGEIVDGYLVDRIDRGLVRLTKERK